MSDESYGKISQFDLASVMELVELHGESHDLLASLFNFIPNRQY